MADEKPKTKSPPAKASPVAGIILAVVGILVILSLFGALLSSLLDGELSGTTGALFSYLKTIATVISMIALVVIIYSYVRINELAGEESKKMGLELNWNTERSQKNKRWEKVEEYMSSLNPSDWKIAILEADNILDEVIERMGYKGESLGERMKNIEKSDFPYLEEAWQAHKVRNAIAHKGTNYEIRRSDAEQTINIYYRIFKELGYL